MAAVDTRLNDEIAKVQMRLAHQRLQLEQELSPDTSRALDPPKEDHDIRLQRALERRRELLNRLQEEYELRHRLGQRGRFGGGHREVRSPHPDTGRSQLRSGGSEPPQGRKRHSGGSRASLRSSESPGNGNERHSVTDKNPQHQIIEHQFKPYRLEPLDVAAVRPQEPVPVPIYLPVGTEQRSSTKHEMMELMMIQNAQMHQMMMQQLMMAAIPKQEPEVHHLTADDLRRNTSTDRKRPPSVHHHIYPQPPLGSLPHYSPPVQMPTAQMGEYLSPPAVQPSRQMPQNNYVSVPPVMWSPYQTIPPIMGPPYWIQNENQSRRPAMRDASLETDE